MKYLHWIKDNVVAVLGFIVAVLAFILYQKWKQDQVNSLKDSLSVAKATGEIKALDARREVIGERIENLDMCVAGPHQHHVLFTHRAFHRIDSPHIFSRFRPAASSGRRLAANRYQ